MKVPPFLPSVLGIKKEIAKYEYANISEHTDISAQYPDIVSRLKAAWDDGNAALKPPALDKDAVKRSKK